MDAKALTDIFAQLDKLAAVPIAKAKLFSGLFLCVVGCLPLSLCCFGKGSSNIHACAVMMYVCMCVVVCAAMCADEDLASADVPFQLIGHGPSGDVSVVPDDASNGIDAPAFVATPTVSTASIPLPTHTPSPAQLLERQYFASTTDSHLPTPSYLASFSPELVPAAVNHALDAPLFPYAVEPHGHGSDPKAMALSDAVCYGDESVLNVSAPTTSLALVRHPLDGYVVGWEETALQSGAGGSGGSGSGSGGLSGTAHSSQSMLRAPGARTEFVRGSIANMPFRPGGLDAPSAAATAEQR